jgi:hypothetical protein
MSIYSTTAMPSLDLLGGVEAIQRMLKPHTEISKVAWDETNSRAVAVLETHGGQNALQSITSALREMEVPIFECKSLTDAVITARILSSSENVVDFTPFSTDDPFSV